MSQLAAVFDTLGQDVMPDVISAVANGECRILGADGEDTSDDQGFPAPAYGKRTYDFIPCVWKERSESFTDEQNIAGQTRGFWRYEVTIPRVFNGDPVVITTADRLELRQRIGDETTRTLEIVGPVNVSNVIWKVRAIDTDLPTSS